MDVLFFAIYSGHDDKKVFVFPLFCSAFLLSVDLYCADICTFSVLTSVGSDLPPQYIQCTVYVIYTFMQISVSLSVFLAYGLPF